MTDHIAAAVEAGKRIEAIRAERDAAMTAARRDRRAAINAARATMSAQEIADQLGISRARVYAIAAGRE